MNNRLKILDIWVDPVDMGQALARVWKYLNKGKRPHSVFASNPEKAFSVTKDPELREIYRTSDLLIPDGIGVVLACRILYGLKITRVPGVDLMKRICERAAENGHRIFIYGATEKTNKSAVAILEKRYLGIKIVGRSNGYIIDEQMPQLIDKINSSEAEILFLALGSPKQETWYSLHKSSLETVKLCQGIGGTLDTIVGTVKRAPRAWQKYNVEWLYRLLSEPKRIKRQKVLPLFALMVLRAKLNDIVDSNEKK